MKLSVSPSKEELNRKSPFGMERSSVDQSHNKSFMKDDLRKTIGSKGSPSKKGGVFSKNKDAVTTQMENAVRTNLIAEKFEAEKEMKKELTE